MKSFILDTSWLFDYFVFLLFLRFCLLEEPLLSPVLCLDLPANPHDVVPLDANSAGSHDMHGVIIWIPAKESPELVLIGCEFIFIA